jgi:protease-4
VVQDICASGGYYIAAAADRIYVNPSSIVGSIGVIMNGFELS